MIDKATTMRTKHVLIVASLIVAGASACAAEPGGPAAVDNPLQLAAHHVTLSVADIDKESEWYQRVLGFREVRRVRPSDSVEVRQLAIPGFGIDLAWQKGSTRQHQSSDVFNQGWQHIVFTAPVLETIRERLARLGADVRAMTNPQGALSRLAIYDPEGNEIEIMAQRP